MKQPMQPVVLDENGTPRFQGNAIVKKLYEASAERGYSMNHIWREFGQGAFSLDDMEQFYMLIGYSVGGFGEMSDFRDETYNAAEEQAKKLEAKG